MEEQLAQRRQYLRKVKGDQKATISRLRKEVENYANRLKSANDENKQRQRTMQLERTIKQTEEQIQNLSQRVKDSENVPELERAEWKRARNRFESEMERLAELRADLERFRKTSNEKISSVQSELTNTVQKRERLQARTVRLTEQLERITVANEKGMNERERRAAEQLAREQERANIEANFLEQITLLANSVHDYQGRTANLWSQANAIDQAFQAQQQQYYLLQNNVNAAVAAAAAGNAVPDSLAEGPLPGTNTDLSGIAATATSGTNRSALAAFSPFGQSAMGSMSPAISSTALDQFLPQHHLHHHHPQHSHSSFHHHTPTSAAPFHQTHSLTPTFNSAIVQSAFSPAVTTAATADAHTPSGASGSGGSTGSGSNSNVNVNSNSKRHRSLSNFSGRSIQLDKNGTPYLADALNRPVIHENAATAAAASASPIATTTATAMTTMSADSPASASASSSHGAVKWGVKE